MAGDARKDLIRRFYEEAWSRGELAVIEELFADDYVTPLPNAPSGPAGERQHVAMIRAAFPDLQLVVQELVAEGETVAARWTMSGTNSGSFMGRAPTDQQISVWGVDFFHFTGDRISSGWVGVDMLGLMIQLGVLPSPWPAEEPSTEPSG
jgi:steroid delta-isomerase-like uncharacterized protein